jgi:hypothetical protein
MLTLLVLQKHSRPKSGSFQGRHVHVPFMFLKNSFRLPQAYYHSVWLNNPTGRSTKQLQRAVHFHWITDRNRKFLSEEFIQNRRWKCSGSYRKIQNSIAIRMKSTDLITQNVISALNRLAICLGLDWSPWVRPYCKYVDAINHDTIKPKSISNDHSESVQMVSVSNSRIETLGIWYCQSHWAQSKYEGLGL